MTDEKKTLRNVKTSASSHDDEKMVEICHDGDGTIQCWNDGSKMTP